MNAAFDLVIRNGTIADGRGGEPFTGDVAITGKQIAAVGSFSGSGREEIDAKGLLVTPGFVDVHTHYDGQITWENTLMPSSNHGVTTVLMGNCGVGFAPCKPHERELLMMLMEGIEEIPLPVMAAGIPWEWQSFPEFLDFLDGRTTDVDFATQVPHGAVRVYAMGERGVAREPATDEDAARMTHIVQEAVAAGALGFSTSRTLNHRTNAGALAPTVTAAEEELLAIARGLGAIGKGVLQFVDDFHLTDEDGSAEFAMWQRIGKAAQRPMSFSLFQARTAPEQWRAILKFVERANADGVTIRGQVASRAVANLFGLELTAHPFSRCPSYAALAKLPLAERVAAMRRPDVRERLLAEGPQAEANQPMRRSPRTLDGMYAFGDPPNYSPDVEDNFSARAARSGASKWALVYDALLEQDGHAMLYYPSANFAYNNLDASLEMMQHPNTIIGLGDGGAHVGRICDASIPTHVLAYWTRDRRGERLGLPAAVRMLAHDTARAVGLDDRGVLAPGYKADVNVIDYDKLTLRAPRLDNGLPAGGRRLTQRADGYVATVLSGIVTFRNGTATGAFPGRLVRGAQPQPTG